jgi:hypothetical protein
MTAITRSGRPHRLVSLAILVLAATAAACAGSSAAPAASSVDTYGGNGGGGPIAAPSAAPSAAASAAAAEDGSGSVPYPSGAPQTTTDNLQIVYTGSLDLIVTDIVPALARAKTIVTAAGGYIGASQESNANDHPSATITYRIPASRWGDVLDSLRGVGSKIVAEQTQATEVGGQLVDLEARIRNLRASETALLEIAKGAGKVSDLLEVQAQLTDVRGQIEQLDGQRAHLVDQVAYGTLVTTFGLEVVAVKETTKGWDPGKEVDAAMASLIGIGQGVGSAAIWFAIVGLPLLIVLLIAGVIMRFLFRHFGPKPVAHGPVPGWGSGDVPPAGDAPSA